MKWMGWTALGTGLLVVGGAGLLAVGSSRWAGATQAQMALLEAARLPAPAGLNKVYDARELDGLPAPVQRYFRAVLKDGQRFIAAATFELAGKINMSASGGEQWKPFTSTQRAVTHRPGVAALLLVRRESGQKVMSRTDGQAGHQQQVVRRRLARHVARADQGLQLRHGHSGNLAPAREHHVCGGAGLIDGCDDVAV